MDGNAVTESPAAVATDQTYKARTISDLSSLKGNTTVITGASYLAALKVPHSM
jgi:hypothetical protein